MTTTPNESVREEAEREFQKFWDHLDDKLPGDEDTRLAVMELSNHAFTAGFCVGGKSGASRVAASLEQAIKGFRVTTRIEGRQLTHADVGSKVTYVPQHADGAGHPDCEGGTITSWNDKYVFVNYGTGTNKATDPSDLRWG